MYAAVWIVGKTRGIWLLTRLAARRPRRLVAARPHRAALRAAAARMGGSHRLARVCGIAVCSARACATRSAEVRPVARCARNCSCRRSPTRRAPSSISLLGTNRPWIVAFGQAIPIAAAAWLIDLPRVWLLYPDAVQRNLRRDHDHGGRAQPRTVAQVRVDASGDVCARRGRVPALQRLRARRVCCCCSSPSARIARCRRRCSRSACTLLALSSVVSSYLGLVMTRGLGWLETALRRPDDGPAHGYRRRRGRRER